MKTNKQFIDEIYQKYDEYVIEKQKKKKKYDESSKCCKQYL